MGRYGCRLRPWLRAGARVGLIVLAFPVIARPGISSGQASRGAHTIAGTLQGHRCVEPIRATLEEWGVEANTVTSANGPIGVRVITIPTARLGVWVVLRLHRDGSATAARVSPRHTDRASWTPACVALQRPAVETQPPGAERTGAFTDRGLEETLNRFDSGVIFLWSPHMPLSISGYRSIGQATERLGLALVPLLDPLADADYAAATMIEQGFPSEAGRPAASVELSFRDLTTHAPSIQVFRHGRLVGEMLPVYRDPDHYVSFIARQ